MKILLLVCAVVGGALLLLFVAPALIQKRDGLPMDRVQINALEVALESFRADFGAYPQGNSASIASQLIGQNSLKRVYIELDRGWKDGFLLDPWGRPYMFSYTAEGTPLIRSLGEDIHDSKDDKTNMGDQR